MILPTMRTSSTGGNASEMRGSMTTTDGWIINDWS
jgi:hypothetical protein